MATYHPPQWPSQHKSHHPIIVHTGHPSDTASSFYPPQTATRSFLTMAIWKDYILRQPPHWKPLCYHKIPLSSTMAIPMDITPPHHAPHWKPLCHSNIPLSWTNGHPNGHHTPWSSLLETPRSSQPPSIIYNCPPIILHNGHPNIRHINPSSYTLATPSN